MPPAEAAAAVPTAADAATAAAAARAQTELTPAGARDASRRTPAATPHQWLSSPVPTEPPAPPPAPPAADVDGPHVAPPTGSGARDEPLSRSGGAGREREKTSREPLASAAARPARSEARSIETRDARPPLEAARDANAPPGARAQHVRPTRLDVQLLLEAAPEGARRRGGADR